LFYKRTPGWSAWSTALVAGAASWLLERYVSPDLFQHWMGWQKPLTADEGTYLKLAVTTIGGTVIIGSAWYFFTSLFYKAAPAAEHERIDTFFQNLHTPVDNQGQGVEDAQTSIYKLLGGLCMVYGGFILLLMAIPNKFTGRLAFLFCGGVMFSAGFLIFKRGQRKAKLAREKAASTPADIRMRTNG
jgi:uncharacterized BrkB/YihY/UPF0761 family membrane protein